MKSTNPVSHEKISERAHQIWEQSGRPDTGETDHWLQAERELNVRSAELEERSEDRSLEPKLTGKRASQKTPHSTSYEHPGVTTDSLHHHRKG